jgi:predicted permease
MRLTQWLSEFRSDLVFGFRQLLRTWTFAGVAILTMALGIGANTAMFSIVDRILFRPMSLMRDEASVSRVYQQWMEDGKEQSASTMPYQRFVDIRDQTKSFSEVAGYSTYDVGVGLAGAARERPVAAVSASFFHLYDAKPALGRFIQESDDTPPFGAAVVLLTWSFWQTEFGGRDVVGEFLQVGDVRAQIVGVAPKGLGGLEELDPPAVFIPAATLGLARGLPRATVISFYKYHPWNSVATLVRRKPDVSIEAATAELTQVMRASWDTERASRQVGMFRDAQAKSASEAQVRAPLAGVRRAAGPDRPVETQAMLWISGVAFLVLVIACANVMNLMLARTLKRQREVAMRIALGISRGRLVLQAAIEGTILALASGAAALLVAQWGAAVVARLFLDDELAPGASFVDRRTTMLALALSVGIGLLIGVGQVLLAQSRDLAGTLRAGSKSAGAPRARFRSGLLIVQGALSVVLLVGATLFLGSLRAAEAVPKGYDLSQVLIVTPVFRSADSAVDRGAANRNLEMAAAAVPGVERVASAIAAPLWRTARWPIFVAGIDSVSRLGEFTANAVAANYFEVMSTRILRGRPITAGDQAEAAPVIVVSRGMAEALWPGQEAVGKCIRVFADTMPCRAVIGVAEDIVQSNYQLGAPTRYHYYVAADQLPPAPRYLLVSASGDPAVQAERLRLALQRVMPGTSYVTVRPMATLLDGTYRTWRLGAAMFLCFGLLALAVASVGLYGIIGYEVTQRMHELGVRVALGARRADILGLIVGRTVRLMLAGIVAGSALCLFAGRWLQPLLFQQSATDPRVYAIAALAMLVVAILASSLPANRASRADPNRSLRSD